MDMKKHTEAYALIMTDIVYTTRFLNEDYMIVENTKLLIKKKKKKKIKIDFFY